MDEMSQIHEISMQKIEFLFKLRETYNVDPKFHGTTNEISLLQNQIEEAVRKIKKDNENFPRLINDLKASLDVVMIPSPCMKSVS